VLGEITDASNQAIAFPAYGLCWPVGSIIGCVPHSLFWCCTLAHAATAIPHSRRQSACWRHIFAPSGEVRNFPQFTTPSGIPVLPAMSHLRCHFTGWSDIRMVLPRRGPSDFIIGSVLISDQIFRRSQASAACSSVTDLPQTELTPRKHMEPSTAPMYTRISLHLMLSLGICTLFRSRATRTPT